MLVAHVINQLVRSGAEKQLRELVARSSLRNEILELHDLPSSSAWRLLNELRVRLTKLSPDAVVAWLDRPQIAVSLAKPAGVVSIASVRGPPQRRSKRKALPLWLALSRYDGAVANSRALKEATRAFAWPIRVAPFEVINNGVELPTPRDGSRIEPPLRLGYIGRATPWKGIDVLLDAVARLDPGSVELTLVGAGVPEEVALRAPDGALCRAIGRGPDPWRVISDVDILVVPSRKWSEGSPNVVLEAFARGVPVIGTTDPGLAELLAEGRGVVVPEGNSRALSEAIRRAIVEPHHLMKRAKRARAYVERHHSWEQVVERWDHFLRSCIPRLRQGRSSPSGAAS